MRGSYQTVPWKGPLPKSQKPILTTEAAVCTVFWSAEARSPLRRFRFCFESRKALRFPCSERCTVYCLPTRRTDRKPRNPCRLAQSLKSELCAHPETRTPGSQPRDHHGSQPGRLCYSLQSRSLHRFQPESASEHGKDSGDRLWKGTALF